MRLKRFILFLTALVMVLPAAAKKHDADTLLYEEIDSNYIKKYSVINDYDILGIDVGCSFANCSFQPVRTQTMSFRPINAGILYTHYCKMFGYMPYFGFQMGAYYSEEAYEFKENSSTGYTDYILNAYKGVYRILEVPIMAHFHYDFWKMKIMLGLGVYGGYRFSVKREYVEGVTDRTYETSFHANENRWDYGIKGGGGIGFVFDPIELHITCNYRYSWSNLHKPNVDAHTLEHATEENPNPNYYYKWSYPTNIIVSVGIFYQLTTRMGRSKSELKAEARESIKAEALRIQEQLKMEELKAQTEMPGDMNGDMPGSHDELLKMELKGAPANESLNESSVENKQ